MKTVSDLITEYSDLLGKVEDMLRAKHQDEWVSALQSWRKELEPRPAKVVLGAHAKRTARALGGMESIGEIAQTDGDEEMLRLVAALFANCKETITACGV